jgi:DNA-binding response OmpR family regulator/DNA-binding CsgD family transcriptional regulator
MTTDHLDLIMVVDDDVETRQMLTAALEQAGLKAVGVPDGQSALDLLEDLRPNLIVLDAVMGGLSGFETCRRLKADPDHAYLPVIFITGLTETEHVVEGLMAGGVDYVTKPVVLQELIARIRVHLSTAQLAHSARVALDMAGRSLFAADAEGLLLWRTPQTVQLLANIRAVTLDRTEWPLPLVDHVRRLIAKGYEVGSGSSLVTCGQGQLEIALLGRGGPNEYYFRMSEPVGGREAGMLKGALGLTSREAEVLVWISSGKSNRDISDILNISPRTVNKHLEQIFTKLGVENRAAAAAVATRIVAARS